MATKIFGFPACTAERQDCATAVPHCAPGARIGADYKTGRTRPSRLVRKARQESAKTECVQKILSLKAENDILRSELSQWEGWYYGSSAQGWHGAVGSEVQARVRRIEPVIYKKVAAAVTGTTPHVPGDMRAARNVAEHNYTDWIVSLAKDGPTARAAQRGTRRKPLLVISEGPSNHAAFDVWELLDQAAVAALAGSACGVIVVGSGHDGEILYAGESLFNTIVQRREAASEIVAKVKSECARDDWLLRADDVVYVGAETRPSIVMRSGYGDYEREVRVRSILEHPGKWSTGRWVRTDWCHKLEVDDYLTATADFVDSSDAMVPIPKGTCCRYVGRDEDQDVVIQIGLRRLVVFAQDLHNLSLR